MCPQRKHFHELQMTLEPHDERTFIEFTVTEDFWLVPDVAKERIC